MKPCPFCGNKKPETWWDFNEPGYEEGYNIKCCCVEICAVYKEEAITRWNTRY